jgi:hypothetical protein
MHALGASRFDLKYSSGTLRHELLMRSIELYGREVIPRVRQLLAAAGHAPAGGGVAASGSESRPASASHVGRNAS